MTTRQWSLGAQPVSRCRHGRRPWERVRPRQTRSPAGGCQSTRRRGRRSSPRPRKRRPTVPAAAVRPGQAPHRSSRRRRLAPSSGETVPASVTCQRPPLWSLPPHHHRCAILSLRSDLSACSWARRLAVGSRGMRANRGVSFIGGSNAPLSRGLAYNRTLRNGKPQHADMRPRRRAEDLWDVQCICGWSSASHTSWADANSAAAGHRAEVARGEVKSARSSVKGKKKAKANRAKREIDAAATEERRAAVLASWPTAAVRSSGRQPVKSSKGAGGRPKGGAKRAN